MSFAYRKWLYDCQVKINRYNLTVKKKKILLASALVSVISKRKYEKKKFWVHPLLKLRCNHGFYEAIYPTLCLYDNLFKNYMRMSPTQFEDLLLKVGPVISKENYVRESIVAAARLSITLR